MGISINAGWIIPKDENSMPDRIAAARGIEFQLGWFGDPIYKVDIMDNNTTENHCLFEHHIIMSSVERNVSIIIIITINIPWPPVKFT